MNENTTLPKMSFYERAFDDTPAKEVDIKFVHNYIRSLATEAQTYAIRKIALPDLNILETVTAVDAKNIKERQDKLKMDLPGVTLSGTFKQGKYVDNLIEHSGYILIDFDEIPEGTTTHYFNLLKADPYTHLLFVSARGFGLKGAVKIDGSKHQESFEFLEQYYLTLDENLKLDTATKNVNRFMSLPHDPDCYYNPNSQLVEVEAKPQTVYAKREFSYNEVELNSREALENTITWCNKNHSFTDGNRNNYTVHFAGACNRAGVSSTDCLSYLLSLCKTTAQERAVQSGVKAIYRNTGLHGVAPFTRKEIKPSYNTLTPVTNFTKSAQIQPNTTNIETLAQAVEVNELTEPLPMESENPEEFYYQNEFYVKKGCYYIKAQKGNKQIPTAVSNFTMKALYQFDDGSDNTKRLYKFQRDDGAIFIKEIFDKDTVNQQVFQTTLASFSGGWLGSAITLKKIFIKTWKDALCAKNITTMGYNTNADGSDFYALSNCIIQGSEVKMVNDIGVLSTQDSVYYLAPWSKTNLNNVNYSNERKFRFIPGQIDFNKWADLVYKSYPVNGAVGICYIINSIFRDIVFKERGFFPFLYLFGEAGGGKTSFTDAVLRLWGDANPGTPAIGTTVKGLARICGQKRNALTYIKEFDKNFDPMLVPMIKSFYDGVAYGTAATTNDNKTNLFEVTSGIIFDGNILPTAESAFFDRFIIATFEKGNHAQTRDSYNLLQEEVERGLGNVLLNILSEREAFKEQYKRTFFEVYDSLKNHAEYNLKGVPERTLNHVAFLLTPLKINYKNLTFPFDYSEVESKVVADAIEKVHMLQELSETSIFWDAVSHAKNENRLSDKMYYCDVVDCILYIRVNELYPLYVDYCKRSVIEPADKQTLLKLLTAPTYPFLPNTTQKQGGKAYRKDGLGSCYRFSFKKLQHGIEIAGKEINLFEVKLPH